MMRFRSDPALREGLVWAVLCLAGCSSGPAGEPADGFITPQLADAYIPLSHSVFLVAKARGAAFVIAPRIAVTNAHNANLVAMPSIIDISKDYDLLFFRVLGRTTIAEAAPRPGEAVLAYGQGEGDVLHVARGVVADSDMILPPDCAGCAAPHVFTFRGNAGKGFSGGPVVDAANGRVLGVIFGYRDPDSDAARRLVFAYDMAHVEAERARLERHAPN